MIEHRQYIEQSIDGWFEPKAMDLFVEINKLQQNITADIAEIGVYHGKSAVLLGQFTKEKEEVTVVDTFLGYSEDDDFERLFRKHWVHVNGEKPVHVRVKKSQDIVDGDLPKRTRIFHIDGDHSFEGTYNDMEHAQNSLVVGGCMILDDFLNQDWLGVSQAVNEFLRRNSDWCLVAHGWNKTVLVRREDFSLYYEGLRSSPLSKSTNTFQNPFWGNKYVSLK